MIKKMLALAATALVSLNASAGYIQYNLSGPVSGFFIQNDVDRSVAFYSLQVTAPNVWARLQPSGNFASLTGANYSFYGMGPTNFGVHDSLTEVYNYRMWLDFQVSDTPGEFRYWASFEQTQAPEYPRDPWVNKLTPLATHFTGSVVASAPSFDTGFIDEYAKRGMYPDGIPYLVPTRAIPEPASLALFAIGALGAAGLARRRQSAR